MQFGMPTLIEIKTLESCAALCRELGLGFVEFNVDLPDCQIDRLDPVRLSEMAKKCGILLESTVFALTFDTGHNAGNDFQQQPLIKRHIDRLSHMHLHDYSKTRGAHLPFGEGELELGKYLDLAKAHDCRVVLEVKTVDGLRRSVEWLKARGWL